MTHPNPSPVAATPADSSLSMFAWPAVVVQTMWQMQRAQIDALTTWQQSVGGFGQELWDDWVAHWAGGVPLDG